MDSITLSTNYTEKMSYWYKAVYDTEITNTTAAYADYNGQFSITQPTFRFVQIAALPEMTFLRDRIAPRHLQPCPTGTTLRQQQSPHK